MYSYHLFLISSASVRSLLFLSFFVPTFAWNVLLICPVFLKRSLSLSHSILVLCLFALFIYVYLDVDVHLCVSIYEACLLCYQVKVGVPRFLVSPGMASVLGTPVELCLSTHWLRGRQQASFHPPPVLPCQFVINHFLFYFFAKNENMASVHLFIYPTNVSLLLACPRYVSWWMLSDLKSRCWTWRRNLWLPEEGCGRDIIQMCNFCEEWEAGAGEEATGHVAVGATATSSLGGLWGQESSCQTEEPTGPHGTQMESRETGASPGPPASGRTQGPASCWWPLGAGREHGWCAVHSLPRPAVCTGGCSLCLSRGGGVVWAGVGRETGGGEYLHSRAAA